MYLVAQLQQEYTEASPNKQAILRYQKNVLFLIQEFNSILTLSTQAQHQISQVKGHLQPQKTARS